MMKIGIITFCRAYNYGAILQCFALNHYLRKEGYECETIDYYPQYFKEEYVFGYAKKPSLRPWRPLMEWANRWRLFYIVKERTKKFEEFINNNILLSYEQYSDFEDLKTANLKYDCYIAGSDQIWNDNVARSDESYYLTFAAGCKKISYAASFGNISFDANTIEKYSRRLKDFEDISIRESSDVGFARAVTGKDVVVCCDPTMLLTKDEWLKIAKRYSKTSKYILLYYVKNSDKVRTIAKKFSETKKMPVIAVPCNMSSGILLGNDDKKYGFRALTNASPEEFLGLFGDAEYVITNSFHGTVFSMIFQKKFYLFAGDADKELNERALSLLKSVDLTSQTDIKNIDKQIDWNHVKHCMRDKKERAAHFLREALKEKNE